MSNYLLLIVSGGEHFTKLEPLFDALFSDIRKHRSLYQSADYVALREMLEPFEQVTRHKAVVA